MTGKDAINSLMVTVKVVKWTENNMLADMIFALKLKVKAQEVTQFTKCENRIEIKRFFTITIHR